MNKSLVKEMKIRVLTIAEACQVLAEYGMSISPERMRFGLQQNVFPFGDAVKMQKWEYAVYEKKLLEWIAERAEKI